MVGIPCKSNGGHTTENAGSVEIWAQIGGGISRYETEFSPWSQHHGHWLSKQGKKSNFGKIM